MAANGASVVDDRAGITFGVELYVPWDAPEAVVDVLSAGVVPLRQILDVIGLVGRREGRYDGGHGRCAGITYFPSGVVDVDSAVAAGGH